MKKVWFIVNCEKVFKTLSGLKDKVVQPLREQTRDWESTPFEIEVGTIYEIKGDIFYIKSPSLPSDSYLWEVRREDVFPHTAEGKARVLAMAEKLTKEFRKVPKKVLKKSSQGEVPKKVLKKSSQRKIQK